MPLSRLTPRSTRSVLTRKSSSSRAKASDSQRHMHLWTAIRTTRAELDLWQRRVDQVEGLFAKHIIPKEYELTRITSSITAQLIGHFENTELEIPDRSLLGLWVTDNLNGLNDHPFGDSQRTGQLNKQWLQLLNMDGPVENQLARLARQQGFETSTNGTDVQAPMAEPSRAKANQAGDEAHPAASGIEPDEIAGDQSNAEGESQNQYASNGSQKKNGNAAELDQTIRSLEDKLSIERLFRQLAKVLHPDREQDEDARAKKHILMSECLKARKDKDINALLTLYCEHVGELPDDLNNNSHNELVSALEVQLKTLQADLRSRRFGDPVQAMIVERYSASKQSDCERRIHSHATSLQDEINNAIQLDKQLGSRDDLLDALDQRRAVEQDRMSINEMTGY